MRRIVGLVALSVFASLALTTLAVVLTRSSDIRSAIESRRASIAPEPEGGTE